MTQARRIFCVGEVNMDFILRTPPGAFNTTINHSAQTRIGGTGGTMGFLLARLGVRPVMITSFGNDHFAAGLRDVLERAGAELTHCIDVPAETFLVFSVVDADGEKSFWVHPEAGSASHAVLPEHVRPLAFGQNDIVYVSGAALQRQPFRDAALLVLEAAKAASAATVLDLNLRPNSFSDDPDYKDAICRAVTFADIVMGSAEEELPLAVGISDPVTAARTLAEAGHVVISRNGAHGCAAWDDQLRQFNCAALPVQVVDLVGAGDAFNAGYVYALSQDCTIDDCLSWGAASAAAHISGQSFDIKTDFLSTVERWAARRV